MPKWKEIALCMLPGLASVLPMLLKGSPVLNNDMLVAYFCYFWDFHKGWSPAHPLPLWSSSYQCGMPMHAYWQSGYLYPITWILFGPLSPHIGIHLFYAFHFGLGIFGFLKLGPFLRLKPFAAYWAGLCFALSGTMLARYEHATFLAGWSWLPLVLAAFLALRDSPGPRTLGYYAAAVALQAMGGHPQASAASFILIGGFTAAAVTRALRKPAAGAAPGSRRAFPRASPLGPKTDLAWILGGHLLALAWCLPLVAPFLDLVDRTDRYDGAAWDARASGGPAALNGSEFSFAKFSTGAFRPLHFASLALPHALGTPSNGSWWGGESWGEVFLYIGGLGLFFCMFASPRRAGRDMRWLWAAGVFGLWLAFGARLGASQIQYHIPFFNDFRRPARFLILFVLALAALSGHGFQRWAAKPVRARLATWTVFAAASLFLAAMILRCCPGALAWLAECARKLDHLDPGKDYSAKLGRLMGRYAFDSAVAAISAAAVWLYARRGRKTLPILVLVLLFDLLRIHWDHFYLFPASYYRLPPPTVAALDASTRPFWRVNHYLEYPGEEMWEMHNDPMAHFGLLEREKAALSCGIHAVFGYRHVSAHLPLIWKWDIPLTPREKSGRYLFANLPLDEFHGDSLHRLAGFGEVIAYEVKGWKPRLELLRKDPASPSPAVACEPGFSGFRDVCAQEPRDGRLALRGRWDAGDTLLFREHFDAGWRYRLDGGAWRPARETPAHFMALDVDRTAAGMEIDYHPRDFYRWAALAYGLTGCLGLAWLLLRRFLLRR